MQLFFFPRCVWCFSFGKSYVSSFPIIWPFIIPRFFPQPWFINCCCKSSSANCNSQFRKKVWLYHPSNQGLCGWQRYLHCAPHRLGKITRFLAYAWQITIIHQAVFLRMKFCLYTRAVLPLGMTASHPWQKHYLHVMLNFCNFILTFGKVVIKNSVLSSECVLENQRRGADSLWLSSGSANVGGCKEKLLKNRWSLLNCIN